MSREFPTNPISLWIIQKTNLSKDLQTKVLVAAKPWKGTPIYFQVGDSLFVDKVITKAFLKVQVIDNQKKHHTHISDKDDNIHQAEHDQLFLFSVKWKVSSYPTQHRNYLKDTKIKVIGTRFYSSSKMKNHDFSQ